MNGLWSDLIDKLVDNSDVGESTSSHDFIVTSSGSICVVIFWLDTLAVKISGSWRVSSNLSGWGNVISSDGISHVQKNIGILDAINWGQTS